MAWLTRPSAANYLEVADIDTNSTAADVPTSNSFSDGLTMQDGVMVPLNQARLRIKPHLFPHSLC